MYSVYGRRAGWVVGVLTAGAWLSACGGGGGGGGATPPPPATYTLGGTVTGLQGTGLVLQNGSATVTIKGNGAYTFPGTLADKSSYSVSVGTRPSAPSQTCVLKGSTGQIAGSNVDSVAVFCGPAAAKFLYISALDDDRTAGFTIDPSTGALTAVAGSPYSIGTSPQDPAPNPAGTALYVSYSPGVAAFLIDPNSGQLTAVAGSPYVTPVGGSRPVFRPNGSTLYVNLGSAGIAAYAADATTGVLTGVAGSPFSADGSGPPAIDPGGKFLCEGTLSSGLLGFSIDQTTGALSALPSSPFATGGLVSLSVIDPTGKFLYAVNSTTNAINAYTIDSTSGALTPVAGSPFATAVGPVAAQFDVTGHYLYVTHDSQQSNTLIGFAIDASTGALSAVPGSPYVVGTLAYGLAIDPTGKNLYVPNGPAATLAGFSIDGSTGGLTPVPAVVNAPLDAHTLATVDRSGFFFYANNTADLVYRYAVDPQSGGLTEQSSISTGGNGGGRPILVGSQ